MKTSSHTNTFKAFTLIFFSLFILHTQAQDEPFNCVYNAYLFQTNDIYALNLASGTSVMVKENIIDKNINAAAYNNSDGYLWGYVSGEAKTLVRIGKNFQAEKFTINSIPDNATGSYIGDVDANGIYHYGSSKQVVRVDLNPESPTYLTYLNSFFLENNLVIHDWAFNINDNLLYAVEKGTNVLYRINTVTEEVTTLGEVPILSGNNYTYGAVYFDLDGNFYISANQTGTVYRVKSVQNLQPGDAIDSNFFAYGPASGSNDGARCPSAPVPEEDCSNGVDDDGDGLVDCDDPSCSGVASCPTITITTGGNEGGLESNNRLSQKITARNYMRSKTSYKFNVSKAPMFHRDNQIYISNQAKDLEDFIPFDVLPKTDPRVTTPTDLIKLTNASKIVAVDYVNIQQETVASILSLKTENGVYEHTKYICDRLLGGEILGINTFFIHDEQFIKTTIKNPGGEVEHVVSFSVSDEGASYQVESHWNLDKYSKDKSFFNFQVWSNSVDDLYRLTHKILELFKEVKPISGYNNSTPPTLYVRNGYYKNGRLTLNITNTNNASIVTIKGGLRATETSATEPVDTEIDINSYNTKIELDSGTLFDFGFRVESNMGGTPDDVFMADGAWGVDDSSYNTKVLEFDVNTNTDEVNDNGYMVERNIKLVAETGNYVSVYKAFTPRFRAVNLNEFNTLKLNTKGIGTLSIVIMKDDIQDWENQHKYSLNLTDEIETREIDIKEFKNKNNESIDMNNVTMIVFLLETGKVGTVEKKEVWLENIQFKNTEYLSTNNNIIKKNPVSISPNPVKDVTFINFHAPKNSEYTLSIYNQAGKIVQTQNGQVSSGMNAIQYQKAKVANGIYFYQLKIEKGNSYNGKMVFTN